MIFGDSLGDQWGRPKPGPFTDRGGWHDEDRNQSVISQQGASEIDHALDTLAENELARMVMRGEETGRPAEVWFAIKP